MDRILACLDDRALDPLWSIPALRLHICNHLPQWAPDLFSDQPGLLAPTTRQLTFYSDRLLIDAEWFDKPTAAFKETVRQLRLLKTYKEMNRSIVDGWNNPDLPDALYNLYIEKPLVKLLSYNPGMRWIHRVRSLYHWEQRVATVVSQIKRVLYFSQPQHEGIRLFCEEMNRQKKWFGVYTTPDIVHEVYDGNWKYCFWVGTRVVLPEFSREHIRFLDGVACTTALMEEFPNLILGRKFGDKLTPLKPVPEELTDWVDERIAQG